jgi:hypothetical protein
MRRHVRSAIVASAAVLVLAALAERPVAGQRRPPTYRAPRLAGTTQPDLTGVWQALSTANWDLEGHAAGPSPFPRLLGAMGAVPAGQSVVEGNEIPYQPWARAKKLENAKNRLTLKLDESMMVDQSVGDPESKCYLPGLPRATYMPFPFQIVQGVRRIMMVYEFAGAARSIAMENHQQSPVDSWMGWSNGRWDGDTLVVDVTGFNGLTWFDRAGNFHSTALHVVERYTPTGPDHLMYEATIEDPNVFTRPWTIRMPLYRRMEANVRLLEFKCVEFAEEYLYGHLRKPTDK